MTEQHSAKNILLDSRDGILRIQMNRPEKKNALSRAMYQTMADALVGADRDDSIRVALITGTEDCFTSGNDLADFQAAASSGNERKLNPFLPAISRMKKPVIAAVSGPAVGIGTTMLLHCDLVFAGTSARFQLPFVNLGLCPELGSSFLLPRIMGHQKAARLLLLGEPFGAEIACELGIVNEVCEEGKLSELAVGAARRLAGQPPASVRLTKALMKRAHEKTLQEIMEEEIEHFSNRLSSPEAAEAFQAFAEKRKPDFSRFS